MLVFKNEYALVCLILIERSKHVQKNEKVVKNYIDRTEACVIDGNDAVDDNDMQ